MTGEQRFSAVLEEANRGGAVVAVPGEAVRNPGGGGRIPVRAAFDGVVYRGSVVRIGGRSVLGVTKAIRAQLGMFIGDELSVTVRRDDEEGTVPVPEDLTRRPAAHPLARDALGALSYSHRRQQVRWIDEAKRPETRRRRIRSTMDRVEGTT